MGISLLKIKSVDYKSYQNILFALFLVTGAIKFIFVFYEFPIDITLIVGLLIIIDILCNLARIFKKDDLNIFFLCVFFILFLLSIVSLIYSPSKSYKFTKVFSFFLNGLGFIYPLAIIEFKEKVFYKTILITIIPSIFIFLIAKNLYWYSNDYDTQVKYRVFGGSYLLLADCLVFVIFYFIKRNKEVLAFILTALIIALGAKGPFIFTLLIVIYWKRNEIVKTKINKRLFKNFSRLFLWVLPIIFYFNKQVINAFKFGFYRFTEMFEPVKNVTEHSRLDYFEYAIINIFSSLSSIIFGNGIGSFGIMFNGIDEKDYPHNIFLEAWFELGILGLVLIFILMIFPLMLKEKHILFKLAAIYVFLNYLKSGSLDGARVLFAIYGLLIFITEKQYNEG